MGRRLACPTEAEEQAAVLSWAGIMRPRFPCLDMLYASPQGQVYRKRYWRPEVLGMSPGLPDLHLPVARGGFYGCWIELKRLRGGVLSPNQRWWLDRLRAEGHVAEVCKGADAAISVLFAYVAGEMRRAA